ncbi:MAG: hypothetical protein KJ646_02365 [Nanoarchaeota archaeon]|nr:hypothetical protein [Nanoarchaeota archaeon]MBU4116401.1 hypothetical protein [Nanoarchaeota archaeon]
MKKKYLFLILLLIFLAIVTMFVVKNYSYSGSESQSSQEYQNVLSEIEKGNSYISENGSSDDCFPYRYYHRGCYYGGKLKFYNGLLISDLQEYNLTNEEKVQLCYKFTFNGSTAYCLSKNDPDSCVEFSSDDSYLLRICGLEEGETIPTEGMWDPNYKENPIPTVYF